MYFRCEESTEDKREADGYTRHQTCRTRPEIPSAGDCQLRWHFNVEDQGLLQEKTRSQEWKNTLAVQPAILHQSHGLQNVRQSLLER